VIFSFEPLEGMDRSIAGRGRSGCGVAGARVNTCASLAMVENDPFVGILRSLGGLGRPYFEGVVGGLTNICSTGIAGSG
jgi:hypothetical protein